MWCNFLLGDRGDVSTLVWLDFSQGGSAHAWTWLVVHLVSGHVVALWTRRRCTLNVEQE